MGGWGTGMGGSNGEGERRWRARKDYGEKQPKLRSI